MSKAITKKEASTTSKKRKNSKAATTKEVEMIEVQQQMSTNLSIMNQNAE